MCNRRACRLIPVNRASSVALLIQLYLSMDRLDLAKQIYSTAKIWAEDSLIIQLCEAWIGLKQGGEDDGGYQTAFYCYDEMSQLPSANNPVILNGKAVAQAAMHRWPEAEAPLAEALQTVGEPLRSSFEDIQG